MPKWDAPIHRPAGLFCQWKVHCAPFFDYLRRGRSICLFCNTGYDNFRPFSVGFLPLDGCIFAFVSAVSDSSRMLKAACLQGSVKSLGLLLLDLLAAGMGVSLVSPGGLAALSVRYLSRSKNFRSGQRVGGPRFRVVTRRDAAHGACSELADSSRPLIRARLVARWCCA